MRAALYVYFPLFFILAFPRPCAEVGPSVRAQLGFIWGVGTKRPER
jgi:hypothetical protein